MSFASRTIGNLAVGLTAMAAVPAQALPVVNTYQVVSRFAAGPFAEITSLFTLSFDPAMASGPALVTSYSSSNGNAAFNPAVVQFTNSISPGQSSQVTVGGSNAGPEGVPAGTPDFSIIFFTDPITGAVPAGRMLVPFSVDARYTLAGGTTAYETFDNTISIVTGSVPEPASWAFALTGIGLIGAAARRRKVRSLA